MKSNIKLSFEDFALSIRPELKDAYEIYCLSEDDLIGKKVIAIRSGFSCSGGGTIMEIDRIDPYKNTKMVHFKPTEESKHLNVLGWGCLIEELPTSVKLYRL